MMPKAGRTIILLSCSARKAGTPLPAAELYQGTLFKASLAWAQQQQPDAIYILSAKHHLVEPDRVLQPYDLTLNKMPIAELRRWSDTVHEQLSSATDIERDRFIILAGDKYRRFLMPHLRNIELPLEGMRIGEQVQLLQRQVQAADPAHEAAPAACAELHQHLATLPRHRFPFDAEIPKNGIYILFESPVKGKSLGRRSIEAKLAAEGQNLANSRLSGVPMVIKRRFGASLNTAGIRGRAFTPPILLHFLFQ